MNRILLLLFLVAVLVTVAIGSSWRTSRRALNTSLGENAALSNQVTQATAQLAEKEAAIQTLRVRQDLQATDLVSLTNRLTALKADVAAAREQVRLRAQEVQRQEDRVAAVSNEVTGLRERLARQEAQIQSLHTELTTAATAIQKTQQEVSTRQARVNGSETERARLLQQWNDPSLVRAQWKRLTDSPSALKAPFFPVHRPKVAIAPDGSVKESGS